MSEPAEFVFEDFGGIDTYTDKHAIFRKWFASKERGSLRTDFLVDVYGDERGIVRRPGTYKAQAVDTALAGPIYDLKRNRMAVSGGTANPLAPAIGILYGPVSSAAQIAYHRPGFGTTNIGATNFNDASRFMRMIPAGPYRVLLTPVAANANWDQLNGAFAVSTYAKPASTTISSYLIGLAHRRHVLWMAAQDDDNAGEVAVSDRGAPTVGTSGNNFLIDDDGVSISPWGAVSLGDAAIIGRPGDCFRLTGATIDTFRREKIKAGFGFAGQRSVDVLPGGDAALCVTCLPDYAGAAAAMAGPVLDNIALVSESDGKIIGDPVKALIRTASVRGVSAMTSPRVKVWHDKRLVLVALNTLTVYNPSYIVDQPSASAPLTQGSAGSCFVLAYSTRDGSWWLWDVGDTVNGRVGALESATVQGIGETMYVGGSDGLLYAFMESGSSLASFDFAASGVTGKQISPRWKSPPIWIGEKFSIESVKIYGGPVPQQWGVSFRADNQAWGPQRTAVGDDGIPAVVMGDRGTGYTHEFMVYLPTSPLPGSPGNAYPYLSRIVVRYKRIGGQ